MPKILIVEDEEAIAELEKDYLELSGFEVIISNKGDLGLEKALNEKCYALSVKLLSECGGSLDDNGEQSSTYLHVVDRDPVELVITNASLRKDGKIFIMGYSYYTGEEYEQECDVESGMDILNFILSQKSFECHE